MAARIANRLRTDFMPNSSINKQPLANRVQSPELAEIRIEMLPRTSDDGHSTAVWVANQLKLDLAQALNSGANLPQQSHLMGKVVRRFIDDNFGAGRQIPFVKSLINLNDVSAFAFSTLEDQIVKVMTHELGHAHGFLDELTPKATTAPADIMQQDFPDGGRFSDFHYAESAPFLQLMAGIGWRDNRDSQLDKRNVKAALQVIRADSTNGRRHAITLDVVSPPVDYDGDGRTTALDNDQWRRYFGTAQFVGARADGNGNGIVDAADYVAWRNDYSANQAASAYQYIRERLDGVNAGMPTIDGEQTTVATATSDRVQLREFGNRDPREATDSPTSHRTTVFDLNNQANRPPYRHRMPLSGHVPSFVDASVLNNNVTDAMAHQDKVLSVGTSQLRADVVDLLFSIENDQELSVLSTLNDLTRHVGVALRTAVGSPLNAF
jgi:hypothetical protein